MRVPLTILLLLVPILLPASAGALQVSEVTVDYPLAPTLAVPPEGSSDATAGAAVASTVFPRGGWERDWFSYRQSALRGNTKGAEDELEKVLLFRQERGIPNLFGPAAALVHDAGQALRQSRYEDALKLLDQARRLAPEDPGAHFVKAQAILQENRLHVLSSLEALLDGWSLLFSEFRSFFPWLVNQAVWIFLGVGAASIIFIVVYSLRLFPGLAHDLSHLVPVPVWLWYLLPPFALVIFLVAGLGFLWWVLVLPVFLALHLRPRDRLAMAMACLFLLSLPLLLQALSLGNAFHAGSKVRILYEAERGGVNSGEARALEELARRDPADWRPLAVTALLYKREGRLAEAENALRRAAILAPESATIMNNMANLLVLRGLNEEAVAQYRTALRFADDPRIHFNLSQALRNNLQLEEGEREFLVAQKGDPETVNRYAAVVMEGGRPTVDLMGRGMDYVKDSFQLDAEGRSFRESLWKGILPMVGFSRSFLIFPAVALLLLAAWPLGSWLEPSLRCSKCGRFYCVRCSRPNKEGLCSQCNQIFVVRAGVEPANRVRKMMQIIKFQKRWSLLSRVATILLPGLGHAFLEAGFPSLLLMTAAACFWSKWILWYGLFRSGTMLTIHPGVANQVLFFLFLGLFYFIALRQIGRRLEGI